MISHDEYEPIIRGVASELARTYPLHAVDIRQEIYLVFYEAGFQARLRDVMSTDEDGEAGARYVRGMAYKAGGQAGLAEKAHREGFEPDDIARYSEVMVENLLQHFFQWRQDGGLPSAQERDGQPRSNTPENERGDLLAMMCDVSRAYDTLRADDRRLLADYDDLVVSPARWDDLGERHDVSPDAARMRYNRTVTKMCRKLNLYRTIAEMEYEGVGSRRVMSNAHARSITD